MRIMPLLKAACLSLMLSACVAPLLMMSPTSQLMWALLKPLVGFDPNEANLFEQPLIKDRMTAMLGPNYDSTMQLLKTANELQQEGPLFYVVSRYAPVPDVAKQAGMVWNADTNQLSVMLQKGDGATQVFGENLTAATPTWPSAMQEWQAGNPTATALTDAGKVMTGTSGSLLGNVMGNLQQSATQALTDSTSQVIGSATAQAQQQAGAPFGHGLVAQLRVVLGHDLERADIEALGQGQADFAGDGDLFLGGEGQFAGIDVQQTQGLFRILACQATQAEAGGVGHVAIGRGETCGLAHHLRFLRRQRPRRCTPPCPSCPWPTGHRNTAVPFA